MKTFTKLRSDFWINYNNSELISLGVDAQLMALYLQGNSHRNILGAYYLPLLYISSDLKLSLKKVRTTLDKLCSINYCKYDPKTQYVWVCNLLAEQLGGLSSKDNRFTAIQEAWEELPEQLEFLEDIYNKYNKSFNLKSKIFVSKISAPPVVANNVTDSESVPSESGISITTPSSLTDESSTDSGVTPPKKLAYSLQASLEDLSFEAPSKDLLIPFEAPSKPLESPFEGPVKPLRSIIDNRLKIIDNRLDKTNIVPDTARVSEPQATVQDVVGLPLGENKFLNKAAYLLPEENKSLSKAIAPPEENKSLSKNILQVFDHWKTTMHSPNAVLDTKRKTLISTALNLGYTTTNLCDAITGCANTPYNMGHNDRGQCYNGLNVILRDAEQIDRFVKNCHSPPCPNNQRLRGNVQSAQNWLAQKIKTNGDIYA